MNKEWALTFYKQGLIAHQQGNFKIAQTNYEQFLKISKEMKALDLQAEATRILGVLFQHIKNFDAAECNFTESLKLFTSINHVEGISVTKHQVAMIAQNKGEIAKARKLYEECIKLFKSQGDQGRGHLARTYLNLGTIYSQEGDMVQAKELYEKSLDLGEKDHDIGVKSATFYQLGLLAKRQGHKHKAIDYLEKALKNAKEINSADIISIQSLLDEIRSSL